MSTTKPKPATADGPKPFGIVLVREDKSPSLRVMLGSSTNAGPDPIHITVMGPSAGVSCNIQPEEAVQLAAYLVAMAQLAGLPPADMLFTQYLKDARAAGQRHLAQKFPGFVTPAAPTAEPKDK